MSGAILSVLQSFAEAPSWSASAIDRSSLDGRLRLCLDYLGSACRSRTQTQGARHTSQRVSKEVDLWCSIQRLLRASCPLLGEKSTAEQASLNNCSASKEGAGCLSHPSPIQAGKPSIPSQEPGTYTTQRLIRHIDKGES